MPLKYEFSARDWDVKNYEGWQSGGSVVVLTLILAFCAGSDSAQGSVIRKFIASEDEKRSRGRAQLNFEFCYS